MLASKASAGRSGKWGRALAPAHPTPPHPSAAWARPSRARRSAGSREGKPRDPKLKFTLKLLGKNRKMICGCAEWAAS